MNTTESLDEQVRALSERGDELIEAGFDSWETDPTQRCFCAAAPEGHELGSGSCRFRDGERRHLLCPNCRRPASVRVRRERCFQGYYGSAAAYESFTEAETRCCGAWPVHPDGSDADVEECE